MHLKVYLALNNMTVTDLSKTLGCHRSYLSEIVNGSRKPGKRLAKDIEIATEGKVKASEILKNKGK